MSVDVSKYGGLIKYEFTPETARQYIIETDKCKQRCCCLSCIVAMSCFSDYQRAKDYLKARGIKTDLSNNRSTPDL